jgi:hypothetical protein
MDKPYPWICVSVSCPRSRAGYSVVSRSANGQHSPSDRYKRFGAVPVASPLNEERRSLATDADGWIRVTVSISSRDQIGIDAQSPQHTFEVSPHTRRQRH